MYENLMGLPLFNGVSYNRLSEIVGNTRLNFTKHEPGRRIVHAGDPCVRMMFVIGGSVRVAIRNASERFVISQTLEAPAVVSPDFLFGRNTLFPGSVTAIDEVSIMEIEKNDFINIIRSDEVCLFNYLNYLSTNAQKAIDGVLALTGGSLEERIAFWIIALTQRDGKDITLTVRQRDLYALFGVQRSSCIATLDSMVARGLLTYQSNEIRVSDRKALRGVLLKTPD